MPELKITATPDKEDFFGKYEKSGKAGQLLLNNYFKKVDALTKLVISDGNIKHALEIGCGPGLSTQKIHKMLPKEVTLDASEYVKPLVKVAKKNNPKLRIWQEDIYKLKSKDNAYDSIYLLEVLEHLDHPKVALAEIKRILKPDGFLMLGVPREPLWRILNMARGSYWKSLGNTTGHLNHWSARSLQNYLEKEFGEVLTVEKPLPWTICLVKPKK